MSGLQADPIFEFEDEGFGAKVGLGLSLDDAYAFLTQGMILTAAAAPVEHTGAMIALVPSDDDIARLALEDGEAADELHLTLAYLGEAADISDEMRSALISAASYHFTSPITTEAFSVNLFNPHNPDMETALVLGIRGEDLVEPRSNVMSAVRGMMEIPHNHEPWIPHVTMAYTDDVNMAAGITDRLGPITFDKLRFAFGGEVLDIPLAEGAAALIAAFWNPKDHPRDENGRFAENAVTGGKAFDAIPQFTDKWGNTETLPGTDVRGSEVRNAINTYASNVYQRINGELRSNKGNVKKIEGKPGVEKGNVQSTENLQQTVHSLDAGMKNSKLTEDINVIRVIRDPQTVFGKSWKENGDNAGLKWTDNGFISTTPDEDYAKLYADEGSNNVRLNLVAKKGTGALFNMGEADPFGDTGEKLRQIILDRGLTFQVVRDNGTINGIRQLDVEVGKR